jgi:hypothetical protein
MKMARRVNGFNSGIGSDSVDEEKTRSGFVVLTKKIRWLSRGRNENVPDTTEDLLSVLTEDTRGQQQLEGRANIVDLKRDSHLEDLQLVLPALWNGKRTICCGSTAK